jgi:hypothetical protein
MTEQEQKTKQHQNTFNFVLEFQLMRQKVELWMIDHDKEAKERHARTDKQLEDIIKTLSKLPCPERKGWYDRANMQFKAIWFLIGSGAAAIFYKIFK